MINDLPREQTWLMPTVALRGMVVFPGMTIYFDVGRKSSMEALSVAMANDATVFLVAQRDPHTEHPNDIESIYGIGVVAKVCQLIKIPGDNGMRVQVEGLYRAAVVDCYDSGHLVCRIHRLPDMDELSHEETVTSYTRICKHTLERYCEVEPNMPQGLVERLSSHENPMLLYEDIIHNIEFDFDDKQFLLEMDSLAEALPELVEILNKEIRCLETEQQLLAQVQGNLEAQQRDHFLREQMRVIAEELGEDAPETEAAEWQAQILAIKNIDEKSREKLLTECKRYSMLPANSQEAAAQRTYLETVLSLPFDVVDEEIVDINRSQEILERDHYGLTKVKERMLETLAVRQLHPEGSGQILCLVGPPGVGKTSIAKSVAESLGRRYIRISLGGMRDESDIRGHRKTYVASMPGQIIESIRQSGTSNPLFLLDEVDKLGNDFRGDPASALLEVLDKEQNNTFRDHYIEIPFDLSKVFFIATANTVDTIPPALLDRMEVITLSSYTREEKFQIAKQHLVKKQRAAHGLTSRQCVIQDAAIYSMIDYYTREAGVRKLEQAIAALCRKTAKLIVSGERQSVSISAKRVEEMLGPKKYRPEAIPAKNEVGLVNGLAWTSVGGELLPIEVSVLEGTGKLLLTGNLGDVMKESAQAAVSFVRSIAADYGIDPSFYKNRDIHIHAPEGAVPKDGPSAGVALAVALTSALGHFPVRRDMALTGEITLLGKVLPIGGLKEKAIAAYRSGVKTVMIPKDNLPDLDELPDTVRESLTFLPMEKATEALKAMLVLPKGAGATSAEPKPSRAAHSSAPVERAVVCEECR